MSIPPPFPAQPGDVTDDKLTPGQVRSLHSKVDDVLDVLRNEVLVEIRKLGVRVGELEHEQAALVARINATDAATDRRLARLEARVDAMAVPVHPRPRRTSRK